MGRHRDPRCPKCRDNYHAYKGYGVCLGWAVELVRLTKRGGILRCDNCGHEWYSQSNYIRQQKYKEKSNG